MRIKKRHMPLLAGVVAAGILFSSAGAAQAAGYLYTNYKSCTGQSHVFTTGVGTGTISHTHIGNPTSQPVYERTFDGVPLISKTSRYYSGAQGNYRGLIAAQSLGSVATAAIACDV
jgi:hypothetical protein